MDDSITALSRDLRKAAMTLSDDEARFLVDAYYQMQDQRIRSNNQLSSMGEEPHDVLKWFAEQSDKLENYIKTSLDVYSMNHKIGPWLRETKGIGPVIAAGLLAHIDISKAPTAGHIWRYAGLDPTSKWEKGQRRPWNAALKVLCWKLGESFVKVSGNENAMYGQLYKTRKAMEVDNNANHAYAEQAVHILTTRRIGKDTDAYKAYVQGLLPPAHIHARAKRYAVKMFLAHMQLVYYFAEFHELPPAPYPIVHLGHAHVIDPENTDLIPGLTEALALRKRPPMPEAKPAYD